MLSLKKLAIGIAIFGVSLGYGCVAHAQCPGGVCSYPASQPVYATPVRSAVYMTAQAVTAATAPKCGASEHKGLLERIAERREQRKAQRGGGRCR